MPQMMDRLRARIQWFMGMRLAAVTLLLGLSLVFHVTKGERPETFYALIVCTYALTIPYVLILRRLTDPEALVRLTWVQVAGDVLLETVLIARTGGIESPFVVLYTISITVASLVPRRRVGVAAASGCVILLGLLANAQLYGLTELWGWLPPARLSAPEALQSFGVYGAAFLLVGFLSGLLVDQLQEADRSLREKDQGLQRLRDFHENIVHSISSGVFTTDAAGCITSFNPAAQEATGYTFEQVRGRPWEAVFNWHAGLSETHGGEAANRRFEVECTRADGHRLVLGMTLSPLQEDGGVAGMVGVFKDLTQVRDLEEEMRRKAWLASLGEMSAGMAHEIRNPLGALAGAVQMLRLDARGDTTSQRLMDIAVREAARLDHIITEFLQYARPPALHRAEHDLNKILAETLVLIQHEVEDRPGLRLVTALAGEPLVAMVDQDQMRQVFWNLAMNACEAMPKGGQLTIGTKGRSIETGETQAEVVEIFFEDTGEGIAKEHVDKIFLPFFTTKKQGSGLGLAAVHRIVDLHGGWIKVDSEQGRGTRFVVCVPRSAEVGVRLWHEGREPWNGF